MDNSDGEKKAASATVLGALEGSISVLLTLLAGYIATRAGMLNKQSAKQIMKLSTSVFLPCLLIQQMGPELSPSNLGRLWIMPAWGLVSTVIAHGLGWVGVKLFKLPKWTIIASGRPNSNALPLLLLDALDSTGVLDALKKNDSDSSSSTMNRAKTIVLLNAIVQQCFSFAIGPEILEDADQEDHDRLLPGPSGIGATIQDSEHVGLLADHDGMDNTEYPSAPIKQLENIPDIHWPNRILFLEKPVKKIASYLNPPLIGAIIALILGCISPVRKTVFDEEGAFYNSITRAVKNLGDLFVSLQMFAVGGQLATVPTAYPGIKPTSFAIMVRYLAMPALSIGFVFLTAKKGIYVDDPLTWFLLILLPSGPSAMVLASISEMVNKDQGPIAGYLTIAYILSPLISLTATAALQVVTKLES
ncbi:hypothetical protein PUNSTDRAFT_142187 [Punctularia strigosozonata HHB-11173 SS5]|uniref:uncharacterized protein n=1 Tax=Punctularia strigosozonata (strain HHB-11173) TaxID=741275 RepID=UPI00044180DF|nr:uncharacterized protein PUNSTDRAFT_142187 [Punctularia strigosozonata HHB-11173 SS5]EIN12010.1 hypothetical protein PUNSTDRAFT_142187 [Punctularia strigosozonata HHB-11173 SS5]